MASPIRQQIRSGQQVVDVLIYIGNQVACTVPDIVEGLRIPRSTTYRYVSLLRESGLLRKAGRATYCIGPRCVQLDAAFTEALELEAPFYQVLHALAKATGETVALLIPLGDQAICIATVESESPLRYTFSKGRSSSFLRGASAKVMLPWLSRSRSQSIIAGDSTLDTAARQKLLQECDAIRIAGFAVSEGEIDQGVWAAGAPVFGKSGKLQAAVSVMAPAFRVRYREADMINRVISAAAELSNLGALNYAF